MLSFSKGTWSVCLSIMISAITQVSYAQAYCPSTDNFQLMGNYWTAENGKWIAKEPRLNSPSQQTSSNSNLVFNLAIETNGIEFTTNPFDSSEQAYVSQSMICSYLDNSTNPPSPVNMFANTGKPFFVVPLNAEGALSGAWRKEAGTPVCESQNHPTDCPFLPSDTP